MGNKDYNVKLNQEYLRDFIKKNDINMMDASINIGMNPTYLRKAITNGAGRKAFIKMFCVEYGADFEKATTVTEKKEEDSLEINSSNIENILKDMLDKITKLELKVNKISELLDKDFDIVAKVDDLTNIENATLLLNMMLKYGACEEKLYKEKCKENNIPENVCTEAIRSMKLKRKMLNGKSWLEV